MMPLWEVPRSSTAKDIYLGVQAVEDRLVAVVLRAHADTLDLTARLVVCRPQTPKL